MNELKDFIRAMVRPVLALSSWLTILGMAWAGKPVPAELWTIAASLTGFYFGSRGTQPPAGGPGGPPPATP